MTKIYIDTDVIIHAVEESKNKFGKNISNPASDLFWQAIYCKYHLIISSLTLQELYGLKKLDSTKMFFELAKKKIIPVKYSPEEKIMGKQKSEEHESDALHILIAEREKADFIVTRNTDHFNQIGTKIPISKPENLL